MPNRRPRHPAAALAAAALALCAACDSGAPPPSHVDRPAWQLRDLPAAECPMGRAAARIAEVESGDGWEILSLAVDGTVIYGRRQAPGPGYHGRPRYDAKQLDADAGSRPVDIGDGPLVDAALSPAPGHAVAIVTTAGELALWRVGRTTALLDESVTPGLSFSADGTRLAYAGGVAPDLDVYVIDLRGRGDSLPPRRRITRHDGPDYLPALSRDGRRVLFVSGRTGLASLWVAGVDGGEPRQLTPGAHDPARQADARRVSSPDGRAAPLWGKGFVVFFDGGGVSVVSEPAGKLLARQPGARDPYWLRFGEEIAFAAGPGAFMAALLTAEAATP